MAYDNRVPGVDAITVYTALDSYVIIDYIPIAFYVIADYMYPNGM